METTRTRRSWDWPAAWTPVFAANLIVPYPLSTGVVGDAGMPGVYAGIALYWGLGLAACIASPTLAKTIVRGGMIVGVSQLLPFLHLLTGFAAIEFAGPFRTMGQSVVGFVGVILTGGMLLAVAYCLGRFYNAFEAWSMSPKPAVWPLAD